MISQRTISSLKFSQKLEIKKHFEFVREGLEKVETRILHQVDLFDPALRGYIQYAIESNGKRIRPGLCLLAAHATGEVKDVHYDLAVILELIHLASLVHDDIMDGATLRRSKPTANTKWGSEIAVLLGDALLAHSMKLCTRLPRNDVSQAITDAAAEVCSGEIIQTQRRFDLTFSIVEYLRTIEMKTAALFRVATELSAKLNDAPLAFSSALKGYGQSLGTAYQIYDDFVDLWGDEDGTGKTLGTDLAKGKLTLPTLHMLQQLSPVERDRIMELILSKTPESVDAVVSKVVQYGGHTYTSRKSHELLDTAKRHLSVLPETFARQSLTLIPDTLQQHMQSLR